MSEIFVSGAICHILSVSFLARAEYIERKKTHFEASPGPRPGQRAPHFSCAVSYREPALVGQRRFSQLSVADPVRKQVYEESTQ